jgi:hypothetical protein
MLLVAANQVVGLDLDIHSHPDLVVVSRPCSIGSLNRDASLQCPARAIIARGKRSSLRLDWRPIWLKIRRVRSVGE